MRIKSFGLTDIGKVRGENQDTFIADDSLGLYIIADGMGGMEAGAAASKYTVEGISSLAKEYKDTLDEGDGSRISHFLKKTFNEVSRRLYKALGGDTGSTAVTVLIKGMKAYIANTGDSPAYLFRGNKIRRLTKEHNVAGLLVEMGSITQEQARTHPSRNRLTSFIGIKGVVTVNVTEIGLEPGDRILLCSDGLTGMVPENEIEHMLSERKDIEYTAKELVDMANNAGGSDNITVLLLEADL